MKFSKFISLLLCIGMGGATLVQGAIKGRIVNQDSEPIGGATVKLAKNGATVSTNNDGTFELLGTAVRDPFRGLSMDFQPSSNSLCFTVPTRDKISVELFDVRGKLVSTLLSTQLGAGSYTMNIPGKVLKSIASSVYVIKVRSGEALAVKQVVNLGQFNSDLNLQRVAGNPFGLSSGSEAVAKLSAAGAIADTIKVSATNYSPRKLAIATLNEQEVGDLYLFNDVERKVDSVLALMTLDEKIAQMTQAAILELATDELKSKGYGSIYNGGSEEPKGGDGKTLNTPAAWRAWIDGINQQGLQSRLGIPILYGIDAVHGNGKTCGSTLFPHNIGLGCTGDTALVRRLGEICAKELCGIGVSLAFAPCAASVRNEKWGRSYEGYGETAEINALMARAYIRGLQGNLSGDSCVSACIKHYAGEGGAKDGVNQGSATMDDATFRAVHLPQYIEAAKIGVGSVMPSYHSQNGIKCTGNKYILDDVLRGELGFDGFILSDFDAIPQMYIESPEEVAAWPKLYSDREIKEAVGAGIDMNMSTASASRLSWMAKFKALAGNGVDQARIDDACRRILRVKFRMNLWQRPVSNEKHFATIGCQDHRDAARKAVRESMVLLKNDNNVLPLKKSDKIVVCGEWADSIGWQCGAWTKNWQGDIYHTNAELGGTSLLDGMTAVGSNVVSRPDGNNIPTDAKAIVLFLGEIPYAESQGDNDHVMDDWLQHDQNEKSPYALKGYKIYMDLGQIMAENDRVAKTHFADIYTRIKNQAPNVPIVTVLLSGRPIIINTQLNASAAFVAAWFPGTEGKGVAEVLFNDNGANFSGKLTHTWPTSYAQIPINTDAKSDEQAGSGGAPLFQYGFGLKY